MNGKHAIDFFEDMTRLIVSSASDLFRPRLSSVNNGNNCYRNLEVDDRNYSENCKNDEFRKLLSYVNP